MIVVKLDKVMADNKMPLKELSKKIGITECNLSNLKRGKVTSIRFKTLNNICKVLNCQPKDILEYSYDYDDE